MKKSVTIISKIKEYVLKRVRCKYWWMDQVNDLIGITGAILFFFTDYPKWIGVAMLLAFGVMTMYFKQKIDKEFSK